MSFHAPNIDPVILQLGPLTVKWYSMAYLIGILAILKNSKTIVKNFSLSDKYLRIEELLLPIIVGMILGGRIFYVLIYNLDFYMQYPAEILYIHKGGMSFFGGLTGAVVTIFAFSNKHNLSTRRICDIISLNVPIGIFFGRIANFINKELYGKVTDLPWGVVFFQDQPRHPSQLYEAFLEGIVLFFILRYFAYKKKSMLYKGKTTGIALIVYSIARFIAELFREIDIEFIYGNLHVTAGQLFTILTLCIGCILIAKSCNKKDKM
ncbi:prolipoprotein diacylglyceryl transferase [Candidatus Sneabacter namystus]|uniref:Phosphatidylglycerol--prolipoprotein diacylglyceryl transferase n=1 Tax=Candidatus Sneabacter namystus TaxID=2601646 RepID=A0A5C0UHM0_9RICK|nr:prolipoprotein diacylglyceryl transferase [Candidatus Sneabacter namystus]QEK39628.1 prolipoprotein diacylglyceryl transferase [Candidatus Sneabacter namystus]